MRGGGVEKHKRRWIAMKTSLGTVEPRHGTESARRKNRAAKETDKNTGQDRQTQRQ